MYDDLIKKLRHCGNAISCLHCPYWEGCGGSKEDLTQAANAIEELAMKLHGDEAAIAGMKREIERMVIDTANSKPRWIPVTERLPEEGQYVLVSYRTISGAMRAVSYWFLDDRNKVRWGGENELFVTHWMPLPERPEEK